jgi:hypothetical protein
VTGQLHAPAVLSPGKNPDIDTEIFRRPRIVAFLIRAVGGKIAIHIITD